MRALEFITGYVTFKLRYDQIYQLKTTLHTLVPAKSQHQFIIFSVRTFTEDSGILKEFF